MMFTHLKKMFFRYKHQKKKRHIYKENVAKEK